MRAWQLPLSGNWSDTQPLGRNVIAKLSSGCGIGCLMAMIVVATVEPKPNEGASAASAAPVNAMTTWRDHLFDPARAVGGYSGISYTYPNVVRIKKSDGEVTARDLDWIGQPFKAPIYYGARIWRWGGLGRTGTMIDFTHAKAIAKPDSVAKFSGKYRGEALPQTAPMKDVFRKLEFSHGHNILTYNGLFRFGSLFGWVKPYVGAGAGISLPHTEIDFAKDNVRTYEYHFAGFAGQGIAGLEIDLGRTSLFLEYKFTYAPHDVPLSHEPEGTVLPHDLWRQFSGWWRGEEPPGGRLSVNLVSHHGVAGVMIKTGLPGVTVP